MLNANREDVVQDSAWNEAIIRAAGELFIQSVHDFNTHHLLKYTWPRYLQSQGNAYDTAFEGFVNRLVRRVKAQPLIESRESTMEAPSNLEYVPELFTDMSDQPLLAGERGMRSYAAPEYEIDGLSRLGIREQSKAGFLRLLRIYIGIEDKKFKQQPPAWHSRLAKALSSFDTSEVLELRLVPLRSGSWTSAATTKLYFPEIYNTRGDSEGLKLPPGIDVNTIEEGAASDRLRSKLFVQLEASRLDPTEVCTLIIEQHREHGKEYGKWTVECVVAHAWFLFSSSVQPTNCDVKKLRMAAQDSSKILYPGGELYMDTPGTEAPLSHYFGVRNGVIHYIHERYLTYAQEADKSRTEAWVTWLQSKLGVRTIPRLELRGSISPEFQYIVDHCPGNAWLVLLKSHWKQYAVELSSSSLQTALSNAKVKCSSGHRLPLKEVYLESQSILDEPLCAGKVAILAVEDSKNAGWLKFESMGLNTRPNLRLYLSTLSSIRTDATRKWGMKDLKRMYEGINRCFKEDPKLVK